MNTLTQKIKENRERFDKIGAVFSFPSNAENAKAEIPQRDGLPMLYNGMYVNNDIKKFFHSSTIDILDTIERWVEVQIKSIITKPYYSDVHGDREKYEVDREKMLGEIGFNSALTLLQDFIIQTKKEITIL